MSNDKWKMSSFKPHLKWTDRTFQFTFPVEIYPEMIERVRGTPARLEDRVKSIAPDILTKRDGERWSIQENAGHLLDLESLFRQRLDEYLAGAATLHAADMSNRKTYDADHNQVSMQTILSNYREQRSGLVSRLDSLAPETFAAVALHPRLNVPMRLVDMLFFQAEHDDYHLARISELIRLFL
ncbi:MAG TPA: DinB family protein [Pyrinomonadaceae bacterium]|nr:DinB family protein [Pyrinomonadaceae bacterium]